MALKLKKAFTLIELLVVISIIAILIAAVSASFTNAQAKGRDGKRKSDLKSVQQALEVYLQTNGKYPDSTIGKITCNTEDETGIPIDSSTKEWGQSFSCNSTSGPITYAQQLPKDPAYQADANKGYYYYKIPSSNFSYVLSSALENTNDPDLTGLPCTAQTGRNYCVINP